MKEKTADPGRPDIDLHFKYLIKGPLVKCYSRSRPPIIVVDTLDECDSDSWHEAQRRALLQTLVQWSDLPKKFTLMFTGRGDRVPTSLRATSKQIVLFTGREVSADANKDIRRFLEERFAELPGSIFPE